MQILYQVLWYPSRPRTSTRLPFTSFGHPEIAWEAFLADLWTTQVFCTSPVNTVNPFWVWLIIRIAVLIFSCVFVPTQPSTSNPWSSWNSFTAFVVPGPKSPSHPDLPQLYPKVIKFFCKIFTESPVSPSDKNPFCGFLFASIAASTAVRVFGP